jgi:hypothetical protein
MAAFAKLQERQCEVHILFALGAVGNSGARQRFFAPLEHSPNDILGCRYSQRLSDRQLGDPIGVHDGFLLRCLTSATSMSPAAELH